MRLASGATGLMASVVGLCLMILVQPVHASERGWMGVYIEEVGQSVAQEQGLPRFDHALVTRTVDGAPAGPAGIRAGDVIVSVDGEVVSYTRFLEKVAAHSPGDTVSVEIARDGLRGEIEVELTSREAWQRTQAQQTSDSASGDKVQWREGNFFVAMDIVFLPCGNCVSDPAPVAAAFGGTVYFDDILALSGAVGIGVFESERNDVDYGLDPYIRANLKAGHFSNPDFTVYGLVGFESYTPTIDGTSGDSLGDLAIGIGGSFFGNPRRLGGDGLDLELSFVSDSDLDDDIVRFSAVGHF